MCSSERERLRQRQRQFWLQLLMDVSGAIHQTKLAVCGSCARKAEMRGTKEIEDWLTDAQLHFFCRSGGLGRGTVSRQRYA